jgi:hypothetical protein
MLRQLVLGQISCRNTHHYPPGSEYVIASGIALVRPSSRGRTRHKPVPRRACRSRSADAYRDAHNIRGIRHQGNEPAVALQHHGPALGNCKAWEQRRPKHRAQTPRRREPHNSPAHALPQNGRRWQIHAILHLSSAGCCCKQRQNTAAKSLNWNLLCFIGALQFGIPS